MSDEAIWLKRLARASEYWELQEILTQMVAAARETEDPAALAASVDEAIDRIRRERVRDEDELRAYEREYESFRDQQGGVVGWLKRHMPFTETRAEEKRHKEEIADQQAEVLADNLAIARAQVLKESLLPPEQRRLGYVLSHWEDRMGADASARRVKPYAQKRAALARELEQGREFVAAVGAEIEAFSNAKFARDKDRDQKKSNLEVVRSELAPLEDELAAKTRLRDDATGRLREFISADLEHSDPAQRALRRRAAGLDTASERAEAVSKQLVGLQEALEALRGPTETRDGLPARRREIRARIERERADAEAAERSRLLAATLLSEHSARAESAKDAVRRAERTLDAAQKEHEAHVIASGQAELPADVRFEDSSPAAAELVRAQAALAAAREAHDIASAPYEAARSEARKAESHARSAAKSRESLEDELSVLDQEEAALEDALTSARRELAGRLERTPEAVETYIEASDAVELPSAFHASRDRLVRRRRFDLAGGEIAPRDKREIEDALARIALHLKTAHSEQEALDEERADARRRIEAAWARQSRALLGDELASEIFG